MPNLSNVYFSSNYAFYYRIDVTIRGSDPLHPLSHPQTSGPFNDSSLHHLRKSTVNDEPPCPSHIPKRPSHRHPLQMTVVVSYFVFILYTNLPSSIVSHFLLYHQDHPFLCTLNRTSPIQSIHDNPFSKIQTKPATTSLLSQFSSPRVILLQYQLIMSLSTCSVFLPP